MSNLETLTADLTEAIAAMRATSPRSRTRLIQPDEAKDIAAGVVEVVEQAGDDDERAIVRVHGGFVPNSYGYGAESDSVTVIVTLATGETRIRAERTYAQSRCGGNGNLMTARIAKKDQNRGRLVAL